MKQLSKPQSSLWNISIPASDVSKMLADFLPHSMDYYWGLHTDGLDAQGNAIIQLFRSWTGNLIFELTLLADLDRDGHLSTTKDAHFTAIAWETDENIRNGVMTEDEAKTEALHALYQCTEVDLSEHNT